MRMRSKVAVICTLGAAAACSPSPDPDPPPPGRPDAQDCFDCDAGNLGPRWLHVSSLGVGFSHFPGYSVLARTLHVRTGQNRTDVPWTAHSDQSWLSVTPSGMTGGALVLTADPAGLSAGQHVASVRVSSPDDAVRNEQLVRVGLWIGTEDPEDVVLPGVVLDVVANPVEPHVYVHTGGPDVTVRDVHTGAVVRTLGSIVGRAGEMAVSSDGTLLFVNDLDQRNVVAFDLQAGTELRRYPWGSLESDGVAYARPAAHPVLLLASGRAFDVATGDLFSSRLGGVYERTTFAVSPDSRYAYTQDRGLNPSTLRQFHIAYVEASAEPFTAGSFGQQSGGSYGQGMCVSADGSRLFTADSTPYGFVVFDTSDMRQIEEFPGDASPNNAACGWNGLFFGGANGHVWIYRQSGEPIGDFPLATGVLVSDALVLSSDNQRLVAPTLDYVSATPALYFRNVPAP